MRNSLQVQGGTIDDIRLALRQYILEECAGTVDPAALDYDSSLLETGIVDSLFIVSVLAFIDERFGVLVDAEEVPVDELETISDIAAMVEARLKAK